MDSTEANKALVRAYLDLVVSGGDLAAAERYVAEDVVFASPYTPEPARGIQAFGQMIAGLHAAFPDMKLTEQAAVAEGDLVATRWHVGGTHRGAAFAGLPPSGRRFHISGMSFYRIESGKIVEGWVNDDSLGMLRQLGAIGG
ncbi:MAG TPA: ester cyclase [Burkholderiaceae bacterium]|nr:ester cyclase [Burkholderiaceae bacterium]